MSQRGAAGVDDERPDEDRLPVAPVCAGVHPDASAGGAGDRAGELEAAEPGRTGTVEADRVRRAAAGDQQRRPDLRRRELALEPDDERVDSLVGGEQIRAEPDGPHRQVALAAQASACSSSSSAGRASARAGPPIPTVVSFASRTPSSIFTCPPVSSRAACPASSPLRA